MTSSGGYRRDIIRYPFTFFARALTSSPTAFQKRHDFRYHRLHGEEGDADRAGVMVALPLLRQLASQYNMNDIFNAD